jgi:hypothetical protein
MPIVLKRPLRSVVVEELGVLNGVVDGEEMHLAVGDEHLLVLGQEVMQGAGGRLHRLADDKIGKEFLVFRKWFGHLRFSIQCFTTLVSQAAVQLRY